MRSVTDIADDYVLTLRAWRMRFMERLAAVRALGFDDRFVRMWEYYLALSEAGFATGISQDLQIVFEKRRGVAKADGRLSRVPRWLSPVRRRGLPRSRMRKGKSGPRAPAVG